MSDASPQAYLLWAILSVLFLCFLVHHLWQYDRFQCLRWSAGRTPGAFRRVMTYSYLATVPLLVMYSIGMTVLKYAEGFVPLPGPLHGPHDISIAFLARPVSLYTDEGRRWVFPLNMVLSIAWALELVTHLEELTFWLYLLHQTPKKAPWFESWEYMLWCAGSLVSILGLPTTTIIVRNNVDFMDAYIFLVGACASTTNTLAFLYILARFPQFLHGIRLEGAPDDAVERLANFYRLNKTRVLFRFLFTIPLLLVAIDALLGGHVIAGSIFWTDFLLMLSGVGCFASSAITLMVFFPRDSTAPKQVQQVSVVPSTPPPYKNERSPSPDAVSMYSYDSDALSLAAWAPEPKYADFSGYTDFYVEERDACHCTGRECHCAVIGGERMRRVRTQPPRSRQRPRFFSPSEPALDESRWAPGAFARSPDVSRPGSPSPPVPDSPSLVPQRMSAQATPLRMPSPLSPPQAAFQRVTGGVRMVMREREEKGGGVSVSTSPSPYAPPMVTRAMRRRERGGSAPSELHPYVLTFTSPIDLVDIAAHAREQDRVRRRASAFAPL
ncbi:hypothetical protein CERSUDRAFT_118374 [Gelatoporia subvermispora B]|uniref:Transmembrane protein n=1 Tax=Ceriporiopsis subvermispora (strain B) TaxID=914234 RepID=M2R435_CERS8|nr:hypothetical protein CERSUDRAFT_118374 [Gelatoporia subvermispora B]